MVTRDMLIGIGIGAAVAYAADPQAGRRRRALARDQVVRAGRKTRDAVDATARDLANRSSGIVAATRGRWTDSNIDDGRLIERVRARLGRACSHPHSIDVDASEGTVMLRGPILAAEMENVLATVAAVRGVHAVDNELEAHDSAEGIPALQGAGRVGGPSLDILQRNWAPATQALVAVAGLAATGLCVASYARR
jgi:osmotically-inducible protein OsmY